MPRTASAALSVSTRGAGAGTACGTTSATGTFPHLHRPILALRSPRRQGHEMEPAEYALMDAAEEHMWWYRALHRRMLDALVGVHGAVLDAGCGTGGLLARIRAERPDLRPIGLEWVQAASHRAA